MPLDATTAPPEPDSSPPAPRGTPPPFMVGFRLQGRTVVLAGDGDVPRAKADMLLAAGAYLRLLNTDPGPWMLDRIAEGRAHLHPAFDDALFDGVALAMAVDIEDPTAGAFAAAARARGVLVNVADNPPCCDFNTPAYFDRGPIRVALGSGGTAPMLVSLLRQRLERAIDPRIGVLAAAAARLRGAVAAALDKPGRFAFWEDLFDSRIETPGDCPAAAEFAARLEIAQRASGSTKRQARVDLVGAGPGDPELLTFKAARAIARADIVLYDALVDPRIVALARRDAALLDVGKRAGGRSTPQRAICALIAEHARAGKRVVRIKGGDPAVFGRAAEELETARAAGAIVSLIPGVTAASAAAAAIGAPLTARGAAASVTLAGGRGADGGAVRDIADDDSVIAVYMAGRDLAAHAGLLIAHGRDPQTPVAVIENASRADERKRFFTLGDLAETGPIALSGAAVLLLVGETVALSPEWAASRPTAAAPAAAGP